MLACAGHLLVQTGKAETIDAALEQARDCLASGEPREKWNEMLAAQSTDLAALAGQRCTSMSVRMVVELKAPGGQPSITPAT